jgi:hypothetical protein
MQLPTVVRSSLISIPPMYTWPRVLKRALLLMAVIVVVVAYVLLGGGLIALLAILTGQAG